MAENNTNYIDHKLLLIKSISRVFIETEERRLTTLKKKLHIVGNKRWGGREANCQVMRNELIPFGTRITWVLMVVCVFSEIPVPIDLNTPSGNRKRSDNDNIKIAGDSKLDSAPTGKSELFSLAGFSIWESVLPVLHLIRRQYTLSPRHKFTSAQDIYI